MKVFQEFYCATSGGGCGGYVVVKLNIAINGVVEVICPKCSHKHQRCIKDGVLKEQGRYNSNPAQTIEPTIAAWSEEPKCNHEGNERDAAVPKQKRDFLNERLFELYGAKS